MKATSNSHPTSTKQTPSDTGQPKFDVQRLFAKNVFANGLLRNHSR
jgi:hypothetical protein